MVEANFSRADLSHTNLGERPSVSAAAELASLIQRLQA